MAPVDSSLAEAAKMCPFLSKIQTPTSFDFSPLPPVLPNVGSGPIFEDESSFKLAFSLFHGENGVVPLSGNPRGQRVSSSVKPNATAEYKTTCRNGETTLKSGCPFANGFEAALGSSVAAISLSPFGPFGPFGYDAFRSRNKDFGKEKIEKKQEKRPEKQPEKQEPEQPESQSLHEAVGDDWLATGNCPIAKSYRAFSTFIPLVASAIKPPSNFVYKCPPAIVALRAAVAKHPAMETLRPQTLPVKTLAIGALGMMMNIPMGVWREHCEKFSPQWILAVHASVPFVALLRKAALMPKYAMVFTIAASIIGQTIGAKAEKARLAKKRQEDNSLLTYSEHDSQNHSKQKYRCQQRATDTASMRAFPSLKAGLRSSREPEVSWKCSGLEICSPSNFAIVGSLIERSENSRELCSQC